MSKRVTAGEARQRLGMLLDDVRLTGAEYVIERAGRPVGVVIPVEAYQRLQRERAAAFDRVEALRQRLADSVPEEDLQAAIDEATREVRR